MDYHEMEVMYEPINESATEQSPNNMATASLVLGIIAGVTCCCYYGAYICGGLSILFAILSRPEGRFHKNAKIGMTISIVAIVISSIVLILLFIFVMASENGALYGLSGLENVVTTASGALMGGGI